MSKQSTNSGLILCVKLTEDSKVSLYKSLDGVFEHMCDLSDMEAIAILQDYSRVLAWFPHRSDIFSGLYVHEEKSKNLDLHLKAMFKHGRF
jgi:hypothetical protein